MTSTELLGLISIDPEINRCVRGTRALVTVVLDALAARTAPDDIVRHYPTLTPRTPLADTRRGAPRS